MASDIKCPLCGGKTTLRTRRSDKVKFYVCANFPKCKGQVAQDEVYWEKEETQAVKSEPEPSKEITHEKVERTEPSGSGAGIGWISIGLICGIVILISVFLPWCIGQKEVPCSQWHGTGVNIVCQYYDYYTVEETISGLTAITDASSYSSSFPYPYFVLPASIMLIVFAVITVILILGTKSKAGKVTFGWLALLSSIICLVASILAAIASESQYGAIVSAVSSVIAFVVFICGVAILNKQKANLS